MKFFKNIFRAWAFFFFKLAHNTKLRDVSMSFSNCYKSFFIKCIVYSKTYIKFEDN